MTDTDYIKEALSLARLGEGYVSPNPMVGAVVVKDDRVVGRGYHKALGQTHAEANAIDDAGAEAEGATLYVTLEPCNHTGRTPPCTERILSAGIRRVVAAMTDPNPRVKGGGIQYLRQKGVEVVTGVSEDEARRLNEPFIKYILTARPFVTLKCAATLDGRIATRTGDSRWVTGPESRAFVHRLRHAADAVMVGVDTVKVDDPSLTTRLEGQRGKDPKRIILDTRLSIPEGAKVLQPGSDSDTLMVTGDLGNEPGFLEKKERLRKAGVKILQCPLKDGRIDLDHLMARLGELEIANLLIEGGSRVAASALSAGIVDKVFFFYAPKILGGDDGIPICRGPGPDSLSGCIALKDLQVHRFGDDILVEGYVRRTVDGRQ